MGCCLSSGKATAPPVAAAAKTPPPPIEEETVKEVVVQSVSVSVPDSNPIPVADIVPTAPEASDSELRNPLPPPSPPAPEISHNKSDTCSVSHSFSTATTATAASILEDDAVSKPHRHPPPSSSSASRRNMSERISRSPGGRHSPQGKLRPRLARERQQQPLQQNPNHSRRNVVPGPLPRTGLQEGGPRRRSRSPATRAPSSSRRSPMKKREAAAPQEKEGAEEVKVDVKKEEEKVAVEVKKKEEEVVAAKDPEVSMECFIFL
ncbi:hypothetical protein HA466_0124900 [Hirschfeldia incana]|nr:hypothetical protein HA466_0124900 [Hirschfeldia incana]